MSKRIQTLTVPQQILVGIGTLERLKKKNKEQFPHWIDGTISEMEYVLKNSSKLQIGKQIMFKLKSLLFD